MDYIDDKNKNNNDIVLQKISSSSYSDDEDEETTIHICKLLHQIFEPYQQEQQLAINEMLSIIRNHTYHDINYQHPRFISALQNCFAHITDSSTTTTNPNINQVIVLKTFVIAEECNNYIFQTIFQSEELIRQCFKKLINVESYYYENDTDDDVNDNLKSFLLFVCHRIYKIIPRRRPLIKSFLGAVIRRATLVHDDSIKSRSFVTSVVPCLQLCSAIIRGFRSPISLEDRELALKLIFDLHDIPGKISHIQPLLAVLHQPMLFCIEEFLKHEVMHGDTGILSKLVQKITMTWPTGFMGNSPKEILLLQELNIVLKYAGCKKDDAKTSNTLTNDDGGDVGNGSSSQGKNENLITNNKEEEDGGKKKQVVQNNRSLVLNSMARSLLFSRFAQSMMSENSNIVRTVLRMWRDPILVEYFKLNIDQLTSLCLRPLVTNSIKHWNETVRKYAGLVLSWFIKNNMDGTIRICKVLYANEKKEEEVEDSNWRDGKDNYSQKRNANEDMNEMIIIDWITNLIPKEIQNVKKLEKTNTTTITPYEGKKCNDGDDDDDFLDSSLSNKKTSSSRNDGNTDSSSELGKKNIDLSLFDLVFGDDLGKGSFANVRHAKRIIRGTAASNWKEEYAVKNISKKFEKIAKREAFVMNQFSNPYLIKLITSFESTKTYHLVMEYCKAGDLHSVLAQNGPLSTQSAQFISGEILNGLNYIHEKGYVYGDLKVENILVHSSGHVRISDFGSTRLLSECVPGEVEGTAVYLAPELLQHKKASYKSDYWSFGCLIFQILAGRPPGWVVLQDDDNHIDNNNNTMDEGISKKIVSFGNNNEKHGNMKYNKFPNFFHTFASDLLNGLLEHDYKKRFEYKNCVNSNFFDRYILQQRNNDDDNNNVGNDGIDENIFGEKISLDTLYKEQAPKLMKNKNVPLPEGGLWKRRMFSLVVSNIPTLENYDTNYNLNNLDVIVETHFEYNKSWIPSGPSFNIFGENILEKVNESTKSNINSSGSTQPPVRGMHRLPVIGQKSTVTGVATTPYNRLPLRFPGRGGIRRGGLRSRNNNHGNNSNNNHNGSTHERKKKAGLFYKGIDLTAG